MLANNAILKSTESVLLSIFSVPMRVALLYTYKSLYNSLFFVESNWPRAFPHNMFIKAFHHHW